MRLEEIVPGSRVYHNKPDGYYTTEKVERVMETGRVMLSGGEVADPASLEPKPERGSIQGKTRAQLLTEGFPVFDPQQGEAFYYCHKLDNPRAARLVPATKRQVDQLKAAGKLIITT